jgi:hypothetical protein
MAQLYPVDGYMYAVQVSSRTAMARLLMITLPATLTTETAVVDKPAEEHAH